MANVNLKTDFRDGEKLFDYQLNNNFKAIMAALNAMNKIVWQDDQEVPDSILAFRGTTEELMNREIIDGQLLYDVNTGETYIDYEGRRISTGSGNAIHIGEEEPTNPSTQLWIPNDSFVGVGTEVVDSLEGNETNKAPSVAVVNEVLKDITDLVKEVNNPEILQDKSILTPIIPLKGTNYGNYGGSYYYKVGTKVHVHLGLTGLDANTSNTVFQLPEGYIPQTIMPIQGLGQGVGYPIAGQVTSTGTINVYPEKNFALFDFEFEAFE